MSLLAHIAEETGPEGVAVAAVDGEIDASNTDELGSRLRAMLTNRHSALIVDLTGTTYLDSAAINLFFELGADLLQRQQRLHLVVPGTSPIARALAITGLDAAIAVHPSRTEAVARTAS
jgi:anti-anti-sigma factor